jgi:hypothetical protein
LTKPEGIEGLEWNPDKERRWEGFREGIVTEEATITFKSGSETKTVTKTLFLQYTFDPKSSV